MNQTLTNIATALKSIAPTLATMLGGPLAGTAVQALVSAFGLPATAGAADVTQVIQTGAMTPETIAAVRLADQKHAEIIGQQGIDLAKLNADHETVLAQIDAGDRASARTRETVVKDGTPAQLAWLVIGGFIAVSFAQIAAVIGFADEVAKIPPQGWLLIGNVSGYLANEAKQAGAYYFGNNAAADSAQQLLYQSTPADAAKQK